MSLVRSDVILERFQFARSLVSSIWDTLQQENENTIQREQTLLTRQSLCCVPQEMSLESHRNRIPGKLPPLLPDTFYSPDLLALTMCLVNSLFYVNPVTPGWATPRMRFRHWLRLFPTRVSNLLSSSPKETENFFLVRLIDNEFRFIHETFIGLFGTNQLRRDIPNFLYLYGGFQPSLSLGDSFTKNILSRYCPGGHPGFYLLLENVSPQENLESYCSSCSATQFLEVYLQVLYALRWAHRQCDFTHYSLTPNNVLLCLFSSHEKSFRFSLPYETEKGREYLETDRLAILFDFRKAHITYQGEHYGYALEIDQFIFPQRSFPLHDAYQLLCSSLAEMMKAGNPALSELRRLLTFFNSVDSLETILKKEEPLGYSLPLTPEITSVSLDHFLTFIRQEYPCPFLKDHPGKVVLTCRGPDICLSSGNITLQKLNSPLTFGGIFDLFDEITQLVNENRTEEINQRLKTFNYSLESTSAENALHEMLQELEQRLTSLRIPRMISGSINLFSDTFLKTYSTDVFSVLAASDLSEYIRSTRKVLKWATSLYKDNETLFRLQEKKHQQKVLTKRLHQAISLLQDNQKYINTQKKEQPLETQRETDIFSWYWTDLPMYLEILQQGR